MNRLELTRVLPVTRPARILQIVLTTSEEVRPELPDIACSPRKCCVFLLGDRAMA